MVIRSSHTFTDIREHTKGKKNHFSAHENAVAKDPSEQIGYSYGR